MTNAICVASATGISSAVIDDDVVDDDDDDDDDDDHVTNRIRITWQVRLGLDRQDSQQENVRLTDETLVFSRTIIV